MAIGGTSGNPATSGNMLSINLNGVNSNFDLGPSVNTVANQAYAFVKNSFNNDAALVGGTIIGAQNFLAGFANPVINMAQTQQQFNTAVLPNMFTTLQAQNQSLGQQAITAEQQVAQASIAASNASAQAASNSGGGLFGGCYITSAVCETLGLPDDCYTLQTLRKFRDSYMLATNVRRTYVQEYYATAPKAVSVIKEKENAKEIFAQLYSDYILPALLAIEQGNLDRAFKIYRQLVYHVRAKYGNV